MRVVIDGTDIRDVPQESLREKIGMVTQDTSLLHRSIRDNVLYGRPAASEAELTRAIARAEATDFVAELQDVMDATAKKSADVFEQACKAAGNTSVETRLVGNEAADTVLLHARYSDLVIIGQADRSPGQGRTTQGFVEQVLLGAGRPVIIVPHSGKITSFGKRVLFAWDASREAARAASDAMPILSNADVVEVVVINPASSNEHGPQPGTDFALYLSRQGVNAEVRSVTSSMDVGNTLLSHAADFGADLMVMGAYGHSRLREWVLGGATQTVLNTMTVPVLMTH